MSRSHRESKPKFRSIDSCYKLCLGHRSPNRDDESKTLHNAPIFPLRGGKEIAKSLVIYTKKKKKSYTRTDVRMTVTKLTKK